MPFTFKKLCLGLVASGFVVSMAHAEDKALTTESAEKLMSEKNYICLSCHKVDTQLIGPSYQAVAVKYQGQEDAEEMLIKSIKEGASGKWKEEGVTAPMPPNNVTDEDAKALVQWVLSLAPTEAETAKPADTAKDAEKPAEKESVEAEEKESTEAVEKEEPKAEEPKAE